MKPYASWKQGLEEAAKRIAQEQSETLPGFRHAESWRLIDDLLRAALRHQPPMRTETGLLHFHRALEKLAARQADKAHSSSSR